MPLPEASAKRLLDIARDSIAHGLRAGSPLAIDLGDEPAPLREPRAAFVTLHLHRQLRGCIGSIEAYRPLAEDVAQNAYAAAFEDPRFPPVTEAEAGRLDLHISVLTPPLPMTVKDEADLLAQLRPGRDGLILQEGHRRATFLPAVWEDLADPRQFVLYLKRKAGLSPDHWSATMRCWRYEAESIPAAAKDA